MNWWRNSEFSRVRLVATSESNAETLTDRRSTRRTYTYGLNNDFGLQFYNYRNKYTNGRKGQWSKPCQYNKQLIHTGCNNKAYRNIISEKSK